MDILFLLLVAVIFLAVFFDFVNGFHDASNVVATMISSRSMSPEAALIISSVANFIGPFLFGTAVAKTIGKEIVDPSVIDAWVVFGALVGAIFWNLLTWWLGLPSSSSHALIGGMAGSVIAATGFEFLKIEGFIKIVIVLVSSPLVGFAFGWLAQKICVFLSRGATPAVSNLFKRGQLFSSIALSLSHGTNDAQKSMGIITMMLVAYAKANGETRDFVVPSWVVFSCALAMGLGTMTGGWSIIKTVGSGIFKIRPIHGFTGQSSSTAVILGASFMGFPVSTTHVVSSALMGVGSASRIKAVKWHKASEIVVTWFLTIPASAAVAALTYWGLQLARGLF